MIDYAKLRIAHELAEKYQSGNAADFILTTHMFFNNKEGRIKFTFRPCELRTTWVDCEDIDALITKLTKLTELTQPKSKYEIGQQVWLLNNDEDMPQSFVIMEIDLGSDELYSDGECWWVEQQLYPSKASLIEAQLAHWLEMKQGTIEEGQVGSTGPINLCSPSECQHEYTYSANYTSENSQTVVIKKCIKCGVATNLPSLQECQHEPQENFIHPGSPGIKKGRIQMCSKCHEEYFPAKCHHESDCYTYTPGFPTDLSVQYKCIKCEEFY